MAVTTDLPPSMAAVISVAAGSMPPISSTTMSTSGSATREAASVVSSSAGTWVGRGFDRSATAMPASSSRAPLWTASSSARERSSPTRAAPTVPPPSTATRTVGREGSAEVTRQRYRLAGTPTAGQTSRRSRSSRVSRRTTVRAAPSATKTTSGRGTLL